MATSVNVSSSTFDYIDGLLHGTRWSSNSVTTTVSFGFPTSGKAYGADYSESDEPLNAFAALNASQQAASRSAFDMYASVANLAFTERTGAAAADAEIRLAQSSVPETSYAYYPSAVASGGDVWIGNSDDRYDSPVRGNYAFLTFMHEIGHSLGLKHGHEEGSWGPLPYSEDSLEFSVMTYRSYVGDPLDGGYSNGSGSYPQSLMMDDIAALQWMYGADYTTNAGNTVYSWTPGTGQTFIDGVSQGAVASNRIFLTIWDGGGNDTYDLSAYSSGVRIDLEPGGWTTAATSQLANLGDGHTARGSIANARLFFADQRSLIENAIGGSGNDTIGGNRADNRLDGGAGDDTLVYADGDQGGRDTFIGGSNGALGDTASFASGPRVQVNLSFLDADGTAPALSVIETSPNSITVSQIASLSGIENLTGSAFSDFLMGNAGNNTLVGGYGDDTLAYNGGLDTLDGGYGTDTADFSRFGSAVSIRLALVGTGTTPLYEATTSNSASIDAAHLSPIADLLFIEDVIGTSFDDQITGSSGSNTLQGGLGNDRLDGSGGADTILGGGGRDTMIGGADQDVFVFKSVSDSTGSFNQRDVIEDFQRTKSAISPPGYERIDLHGIDADQRAGQSGNQDFTFRGSQAFTGAGQVRVIQAQDAAGRSFSLVQAEVNGDGIADFQLSVFTTNNTLLAAVDFLL